MIYKDILLNSSYHSLMTGMWKMPNSTLFIGFVLKLHIACANGYRKVIRLLLRHGADVNQADNDGWTSLHIAARYNQVISKVNFYSAARNFC